MKAFTIYLLSAIVATTLVATHGEDDQKLFLDLHNQARAQVGVPPLKWDEALAKSALDLGNNKIKPTCDTTMTRNGAYGVNIAYGIFTVTDAVNQWLGQEKNYDHNTNACIKGDFCKYYKQAVWKDSVNLGCATVVCGANWPMYICQYDPAGNVDGVKPY